jgi:hypothetical protein
LEPYKIEDIQASRQSDFENEVKIKQMELDNYMTPQKPKSLNFSDHNTDGKITAMDSLIAEKMAQRNLDIEELQNSQYNTSNINPEKWLTSTETSVKNEKITLQKITSGQLDNKLNTNSNTINNSRLKHINIDSNNNISLSINEKDSKKVSWSDQPQTNTNIFNKLKRQPIEESIDIDKEQTQYIQQQSMPLPQVNQELPTIIPSINPIITSPLITNNEIIKQLNEMNTKVDNLYSMIGELTNIIKNLATARSNTNENTNNIKNETVSD